MNISGFSSIGQMLSGLSSTSMDASKESSGFTAVTSAADTAEQAKPVQGQGAMSLSELFDQESWSNAFLQVQEQLTGAFDSLGDMTGVASIAAVSNGESGKPAGSDADSTDAVDESEEETMFGRFKANLFEGGEFGWDDVVDAVNPLQHIPLVSDIYSAVSGDEQGYLTSLAGNALLGTTPWGMAAKAADIGLEVYSGKNSYAHMADLAGDAYQSLFGSAPAEAESI